MSVIAATKYCALDQVQGSLPTFLPSLPPFRYPFCSPSLPSIFPPCFLPPSLLSAVPFSLPPPSLPSAIPFNPSYGVTITVTTAIKHHTVKLFACPNYQRIKLSRCVSQKPSDFLMICKCYSYLIL